MTRQPPVLLRYRFRTPAQLRNHLHLAEGRTLFFYREPHVELGFGDRIFLEIEFDESEHKVLLRGTVLSSIGGTTPGIWLEFPETHLARTGLHGDGVSPRKQRRLGCEAMVQVAQDDTRAIGRIVDVSLGGARIASVGGLRQEAAVSLRVLASDPSFPSEIGLAQLVWAEEGEMAVRFLRHDPRTRVASMRLFNAVQETWSRVEEGTHPPICCQFGVQLDPRPPALKALFTRHEVN
jgi:hypothetical protein